MITEGVLFTDHYQLTIAQLCHRYGPAERTAQFDYLFRSYPDYGSHQAGYCITCITAGLGPLLDWMDRTWFGREDLEPCAPSAPARGSGVRGRSSTG